MRLILLLTILLLFSTNAFAQVSVLNLIQDSQAYIGEKINEVELTGGSYSELAKSKLEALKGRDFKPQLVKQILDWYHENGGDYQLDIYVVPQRGGLKVLARLKERQKIDVISFEGNFSATGNVLGTLIDVKENSEFDKNSVEDAAKKVANFYTTQGYLSSEVSYTFDPKSRQLLFKIKEGDPTLISSLSFSKLTVLEDKLLRARYEREVAERFAMKVGDRIQRDRVLAGIQNVKDWLREHDFLTAKDPTLEYKVSEDGKVNLSLNIQSGPRIRYGFQGNKKFSYRELMLLVGEVKEVSGANDYLGSVRRRILEAYKEIGYANAQITSLVREDPSKGIRFVSLIVNEG